MSAAVELPTPGGDVIDLDPADEAGGCNGCHRDAELPGRVIVRLWDGPAGGARTLKLNMVLCGGCIAEALSILLGRRHVQAGGEVGDLRYASPVDPDDASSCAAVSDDGMTDEGDAEPAAESGEDRGCCPACESTQVIAHPNGVLECGEQECSATWTGRRKPIDHDGGEDTGRWWDR
jgi:hypothetical protein